MGKGLINFAAGFGGGYLGAVRQADLDKERQEDRAMRKEEFDGRMGEVKAAKDLRVSLADAARPASTIDGTAVTDGSGNRSLYKTAPDAAALDSMQAESDMRAEQAGTPAAPLSLASARGLSAEKGASRIYTDGAEADKALAGYNTPEAKMQRQVNAYDAAGKPGEALSLSNAAMDNQAKTQARADEALQRKIHSLNTPEDMADFVTAYPHDTFGGKLKMEVVRDPTKKTWSVVSTKPDGTRIAIPGDYTEDGPGMERARIQLASRFGNPKDRQTFWQWDQSENRKIKADENKYEFHKAMLDVKEKGIDAKNAYGNSASSREERLAATTQLGTTSRQLVEANKGLRKLLSDPLYSMAKPGSSQHQEIQDARQEITDLKALQAVHSTQLAQSISRGSSSGINGGTANPTEEAMRQNMKGDMGADPQALAREIRTTQADIAKVTDVPSKKLLEEHLVSLQSQQARLPAPSLADARPTSAAKPAQGVRPPLESFGQPAPQQRTSAQPAAAPALTLANAAARAPQAVAAPTAAPVNFDPAAMLPLVAAQNNEMANGRRMSYSADVKAFVDQQRATKQAQDQAESIAYREREFRRAQGRN